MSKVQCVRGTYDLYGAAKRKMKKVVVEASSVVEKYGFEEIETPIFEFTQFGRYFRYRNQRNVLL